MLVNDIRAIIISAATGLYNTGIYPIFLSLRMIHYIRRQKSCYPMTYQEGTVSEGVCQSHLVIGLIPAACPHKHRDIRVVRMVLQGCHCDTIAKLTDLNRQEKWYIMVHFFQELLIMLYLP